MTGESPEQVLDAFRAAALSVTKLYKTSVASQTKSRSDGYQECLEDSLAFLDREGIGLSDGEGLRVRRWVAERLEGRDAIPQVLDSDDDVEKVDPASSPEHNGSNPEAQPALTRNDGMAGNSAPPVAASSRPHHAPPPKNDEPEYLVPTQEQFTFQSQHPYPETYMSLADLDLSDSLAQDRPSRPAVSNSSPRHGRQRGANRTASRPVLGRGAGQKRKANFNLDEIFDLGSLGNGNGRDMFGNGGKRSRHA